MSKETFKLALGGRDLIVEIRDLAEKANGSVFVRYEDEWDPSAGIARRWETLYVESSYDGPDDTEYFPVNTPLEYTEKSRSHFFGGGMFMYTTTGNPPRLIFTPIKALLFTDGMPSNAEVVEKEVYKIGDRIILQENIPPDLGDPRKIMF